ncbi:hypothetical protein P3S68_032157 [Capsicum galapagoense]
MNRTKSRLMDSQEQDQRSGAVLKDREVEEEDPFSDENLPEEYKKVKFSTLTVLQLVLPYYVIEMLSGPPLVEIDQREHEEEEKVMSEVLADLKARTPRKTPTASTPRSSAFSRVISEKEKEKEG